MDESTLKRVDCLVERVIAAGWPDRRALVREQAKS